MIVYSDNHSKNLLLWYFGQKGEDPITKTLNDLGVIIEDKYNDAQISVKAYASIFRSLYNASYLSKEMSEKALQILTESKFKDGIVGGISDKNIKVAHKFGNRLLEDGSIQIHDCGIIYFPKNPYLLCVMTKGKDSAKLKNFIQATSAIFYEEVYKQVN